MKKLLLIFSVFMISFLSCTNSKPDKTGLASVKIANPMKKSSQEEIFEKAGKGFKMPDGASDFEYFIISEKLFQMNYNWNAINCTARFQKDSAFCDISGLYYNWEKSSEEHFENGKILVKYITESSGNIISCALYFDEENKINYSFSISVEGIGPGNIDDVGDLCKNLALQTWNF